MSHTAPPPELKKRLEPILDGLYSSLQGALSIVISSMDGLEVASRVRNTAKTERLAAMASSVATLGDVVGHESDLGGSRSVLVETEQGFVIVVVVKSLRYPLTLSVVAARDTLVGQALLFARQAAQALKEELDKNPTVEMRPPQHKWGI